MKTANYSWEVGKLATLPMVKERYKLGRDALIRIATESGAIRKIGRSLRFDVQKMDAYIDEMAG